MFETFSVRSLATRFHLETVPGEIDDDDIFFLQCFGLVQEGVKLVLYAGC